MKKKILIMTLILFMVLTSSLVIIKPSKAAITEGMLKGKWFYIKNAYSGKYLDVYNGIAQNGTNVQQFDFKGGDNQQWSFFPTDDGYYSIGSKVGTTTTNGTTYIRYALDVNGGVDGNEVNLQLWTANETSAQKFKVGLSPEQNATLVFVTGASNYKKAVTVEKRSCSNEANVFQFDYNGTSNDEWIIEPVNKYAEWGVEYALANYNRPGAVEAYPNMSAVWGNCANFVSQCILSTGEQHYNETWKVYRKNNNYTKPTTVNELNNTWELCQPNASPWVSAVEFGKYWKGKRVIYVKGSEIVNNKEETWNKNFVAGDVIQTAEVGMFGILGDTDHTLFIHGMDIANKNYLLASHNKFYRNKPLIEIAETNQDKYFVFYKMY